jgi:tetratricopeptide (TPR) repeat protein
MKRALAIVQFLCLWLVLDANGQVGHPKELDMLVRQGIDLTLRQDYARADSTFELICIRFPTHPAGYLYRAAVLQTKAMDFEDPIDAVPFDSLIEKGKYAAEGMIRDSPNSPIGHFYLGTATGYSAYSHVERGNWFKGITRGLSSASDFNKAMELDSSFYDAYVGVGTYYYWKSRKTSFLNWALGDRREEGIRLLETAATKGSYNRYAAMSALVTIYLDAGRFREANRWANQGLEKYPDNRIFLWGLATAQEKSEEYERALSTYLILDRSITEARIANPYNEVLCQLNMMKAQIALGQTKELRAHLAKILSFEKYAFPLHLQKRARDKFNQARNIQAKFVVQEE